MQKVSGINFFKESTLESMNYWLVFAFCLILPFNNRYITYLIIPWTILSIVIAINNKIKFKEVLNLSIYYLIFLSITVLSLAYTKDLNYGRKSLETMISLIIMPFLLLVLKKTISGQKVNYLIDSYIAGLLIYILVSLIVLFFRWDIADIASYIKTDTITGTSSYLHLSPILQKSYISMYLVWAIALILWRITNLKDTRPVLFSAVPLVVFFLFVFALGSRAALLTMLIVIIFYMLKFLRRFPFWITISITLAIVLLLIAGLFRFTRIGETVIALKEDPASDKRIPQWTSAVEVVSKAPIFGYGVGDGLNELIRQHEENGFEEDVKLRSNAHNQFLETATQTGIMGMVSLLLILLVPLLESIKKRRELLFLIVSIIFINMLFESLLVRIAGVLFIAFWMNFVSIDQGDPGSS